MAEAVAREALSSGRAARGLFDPAAAVAEAMWDPGYVPMDAVPVARAVQLAYANA